MIYQPSKSIKGSSASLAIFRSFKFPTTSSLNKSFERTSEPKMKRKGDRGSPYHSPLAGENMPKGLPLISIEKEEEDIQILIQFIQVW
jgi:hypothetical protein